MIDHHRLKEKFVEVHGSLPRIFRAPGRVNLIGEHTDYNGGFVLPMAIDRDVVVAVSPRNDRQIKAYSVNFEKAAEFDLDAEHKRENGFWLNYVEGVARILERKIGKLAGANLFIWSDVPSGAGLSSSAALETAVGLALSENSGYNIDHVTLSKIGQQTEHEFVGANVGIMDQFVSAHAQAGHALLLDCRSLKYENVPLNTSDVAVVICDTNVKHDLATSGYNTRRAECEEAVERLKEFLPDIIQLRDVSWADFIKYHERLPTTICRRVRHIVTENIRTLKAAESLKKNELKEFGKQMWLSHTSLRDDFEISCFELDLLVEIARDCRGVYGARMTGGGFGGSTVNLVARENLAEFMEKIVFEYERQTKLLPTILVSEAAAGAEEILIKVC